MYRGVESLYKLLTAIKQGAFRFTNKRVQIKILFILKLVSFESLAGNDSLNGVRKRRLTEERNLNRQL